MRERLPDTPSRWHPRPGYRSPRGISTTTSAVNRGLVTSIDLYGRRDSPGPNQGGEKTMSETNVLVELESVTKTYPGPGPEESVSVLRDISLTVARGETVAVVGPSGSGKSTLLNIMGALDHPTAGTVRLDGQDLEKLSDSDLAAVRNKTIGFVFQLHHLLPQCTALENVLVPTLSGCTPPQADVAEHARHLLARVGMGHREHHLPAQLSGGERLRVAVARSLINRPKLVLADEPTGSLDHVATERVIDLMLSLNADEGVALVFVTHAETVASRLGRVHRLDNGTL